MIGNAASKTQAVLRMVRETKKAVKSESIASKLDVVEFHLLKAIETEDVQVQGVHMAVAKDFLAQAQQAVREAA